NYHWYLKQCLQFGVSNHVEEMIWNENDYMLLHLTSIDGTISSYLYEKLQNSTSDGVVFLLDGNQVQLYDFQHSLVPPPAFSYSITFPNIDDVKQVFYSDRLLATCLSDDSLAIFQLSSALLQELTTLPYPISYDFSNV